MQNNIFLILFFLLGLLTSSCVGVKKEYLLSNNQQIQNLEKQDHKFCESLKLELSSKDNSRSKLYWRCRLSMAKYKIKNNNFARSDSRYNLDINELIAKIAFKVSETPEASLLRENKKLDNLHHLKCVRMGFNFSNENQEKSDDYFTCRKALVDEQQVIPAFGNVKYLKYPNSSYNIGFVIDTRIDKAIKEYKESEQKYPTCIKYYGTKIYFNECAESQEASKKCFAEVDKKRFAKELDKKISCQKKSYLQFPDSLLKEDENKKDIIENRKRTSSYDLNSFFAIGIENVDDFGGNDTKKKNNNKRKEKTQYDKINLYSKFELTKLRQEYIVECQAETDNELKQYQDFLNDSCKKMAEYER